MKRITVNALVDLGCLITFIPSSVFGLVLFFFLPSGGKQRGSHAVCPGFAREQWLTMHNYAGKSILHSYHPPPAPAGEVFQEYQEVS